MQKVVPIYFYLLQFLDVSLNVLNDARQIKKSRSANVQGR